MSLSEKDFYIEFLPLKLTLKDALYRGDDVREALKELKKRLLNDRRRNVIIDEIFGEKLI